jgi:hypothetical protein
MSFTTMVRMEEACMTWYWYWHGSSIGLIA